jgi:hypothetical protein
MKELKVFEGDDPLRKTAVDPETGQFGYFYPQISEEEKRRLQGKQAQRRAYKKKISRHAEEPFTIADMKGTMELTSKIKTNHAGYLLVLQTYATFDGILRLNHKKRMSKKDVQDALKLSRNTFDRFWDAMADLDILREENGHVILDDKVHYKGRPKGDFVRCFPHNIRQLYQEGAPAAELGFLYKLIAFINIETNALCNNPGEMDPEHIDVLTISDIVEIVGVNRNSVSTRIRTMKIGGHTVFAKLIREGKEHILVNPSVLWRKPGDPSSDMMKLFKIPGK